MVYYGLFCHFVADFLCQTRKMGENKSKDINILVHHVVVYTLVLFMMLTIPLGIELAARIAGINGGAHLVIDFITSRITSYLYKENKIHSFWSTIGFDQYLHTCIFIYSLHLITGKLL